MPVAKQDGKPVPGTVLIDGAPTPSKSGTFYLEWRQGGKRVQQPDGTSPREAQDAGRVKSGALADPASAAEVEEDTTPDGRMTIEAAVSTFLTQVKATKSTATHRAYIIDVQ